MKRLNVHGTQLNDEAIAVIASCVDKIEELQFNATDNVTTQLQFNATDNVTTQGWEILSTAINNRATPVS